MRCEEVTFTSEGSPVAGVLRLPAEASATAPRGAVVFCAGMSLTKEVWLPAFAERLVEAGYVTLNFDYRHFGESGGEPRRRLIPSAQVQDTRNAITYLETRGEVARERIGLFGVSLGCSVAAAVAGQDARVACLVAAAGPAHLGRVWGAFDGFAAFRDKVWAARRRFVSEGEVSYVSVAKLLKSDPETCALLEQDVLKHPTWDLEITFESLADLFEFAPEETADRIQAPALYAYPEEDALIARFELSSLYAQTRCPNKRLLCLEGARHVDIYATEGETFTSFSAAAEGWFAEHMPAREG
jgi:alpha-beta hydrolase superfamily lysophospholipase